MRKWLYKGILVVSLLSCTEPLLAQNRIIQQSSSRATATGKNNVAASQVEQYATQNGSANSQQRLTIEQYGSSSATANGENNTVVTDIYQESHQQGTSFIGDRQNIQRATQNSSAAGRNNRVFSHARQYNWQN